MAETVEVPFKIIGNRRCLTQEQIADMPELAVFVMKFRHCFEYMPEQSLYALIEQEDSSDGM